MLLRSLLYKAAMKQLTAGNMARVNLTLHPQNILVDLRFPVILPHAVSSSSLKEDKRLTKLQFRSLAVCLGGAGRQQKVVLTHAGRGDQVGDKRRRNSI